MKRLLLAITAALTASAVHAQEPIVFGVITPLSPPGETSLGQQVKRGSEIAAEYLNEKGGVLGVLPVRSAPTEPPPASKPSFAERVAGAPAAEPVAAAPTPVVQPAPAAQPSPAPVRHAARGEWAIQIGAFANEAEAQAHLHAARSIGAKVLGHADPFTEKVTKGSKEFYRARFAGFDHDGAEAACHHFKRNDIACISLKN